MGRLHWTQFGTGPTQQLKEQTAQELVMVHFLNDASGDGSNIINGAGYNVRERGAQTPNSGRGHFNCSGFGGPKCFESQNLSAQVRGIGMSIGINNWTAINISGF